LIGLPPLVNFAGDIETIWSLGGNDLILRYGNYTENGSEFKYYFVSEPFEILYEVTDKLGEGFKDLQWLP
jgi:hypothetical protein